MLRSLRGYCPFVFKLRCLRLLENPIESSEIAAMIPIISANNINRKRLHEIMLKSTALTFACIFLLSGVFFLPQSSAQTNYYSNNFDSSGALNDGYWSLHDASIQTIGGSNALVVNGEATFLPSQGSYNPLNFTLQFDVYQNIRYDNNTQYQGPFYEGSDSEGNVIVSLGYYIKTVNGTEELMGGLSFAAGPGGLTYSHYYFILGHISDWSTWRITFITAQISQDFYQANVTVTVNNQTITSFNTGKPNADGTAELWLPTITNEPVYTPITAHNLLPLPIAGAPVPTYQPTSNINRDTQYTLLSITKVQPLAANGATPSYIDNFYYGYANTIPTDNTPTPTLTPSGTIIITPTEKPTTAASETQLPNNGPTQPPQKEVFPTTLIVALVVVIIAVALGILVFFRKRKPGSNVSR
jgi:hypothetical protein